MTVRLISVQYVS